MIQKTLSFFEWLLCHTWNLITGLFLAGLAYFANLKGAIHVMCIAFLLDLIFGYLASRKLKGERFSLSKAFIMIERLFFSCAAILLLFAIDKETHQDYVQLYNIIAWLISGMLCYSILDNGDKLTGGKFLGAVKTFLGSKIKEQTGLNPDSYDNG